MASTLWHASDVGQRSVQRCALFQMSLPPPTVVANGLDLHPRRREAWFVHKLMVNKRRNKTPCGEVRSGRRYPVRSRKGEQDSNARNPSELEG